MTITDHERQTFTVQEAARQLGIGRSTMFDPIHRGDIPALRLGRRLVVARLVIAKMLEDRAAVRLQPVAQLTEFH